MVNQNQIHSPCDTSPRRVNTTEGPIVTNDISTRSLTSQCTDTSEMNHETVKEHDPRPSSGLPTTINASINDVNLKFTCQYQIQEHEDTTYNSSMFSLTQSLVPALPPARTRLATGHPEKSDHASLSTLPGRSQSNKNDAASTMIALPSGMRCFLGRPETSAEHIKSRNPPPNSLLDVCTSRIDVWPYPYMSLILSRVGRSVE